MATKEKKKFKETFVGKLLGNVLTTAADSNPVTKLVKKVIVGGVIESTPLSALKGFMDVNQDGKIDIKDLRAIRWDDILKVAVVGGIWFSLYHFKLLSALGF